MNAYLAAFLVTPAALWVVFRIIMRLKTRKDSGEVFTTWTKTWGYPLLAFGYLLDFLTNIVHGTILFLELPKELTVSARVSRHTHDKTVPAWYMRPLVMYRYKVACLLRDRLLKPYDPSGGHD